MLCQKAVTLLTRAQAFFLTAARGDIQDRARPEDWIARIIRFHGRFVQNPDQVAINANHPVLGAKAAAITKRAARFLFDASLVVAMHTSAPGQARVLQSY